MTTKFGVVRHVGRGVF